MFGFRLLILHFSEAFSLLTGLLIHADFIPVHKRNRFCFNFHVAIHTCTVWSVSPPMRCFLCQQLGLAVCSCYPIGHPFVPTSLLWGSYSLYLVQVYCLQPGMAVWSKTHRNEDISQEFWQENENHFKDLHGCEWSCVQWPQNQHSAEQPAVWTTVLIEHHWTMVLS